MNIDEKILKTLEDLKQGQKNLEQGQKHLETGLAQHTTLLKALGAGYQAIVEQLKTIRITTATKKDVDTIVEATVEAAKKELKADIYLLDAKLIRKVHSNERRIDNIEKHENIPNPEKH